MQRTLIVITLVLFAVLSAAALWHDAKANGRNIWPWIAVTLAFGSFGPLLYLLTRKSSAKPA